MLKVPMSVFAILSLFLWSCEASTETSSSGADSSQTEQVKQSKSETPTQDAKYESVTPLRVGEKVTQISPYIMANYGFQKLTGAEHFQISLFTTAYESMVRENDNPIVAILFVQRGDLQEMPLAFYIFGKLDPEFSDTLNFCVFDPDDEDKLIVYASYSCVVGKAPETGSITIELNLSENSVMINEVENYKLN